MAKWKSFSDAPPVERFLRGHIYHFEESTYSGIYLYIRRGMGDKGPKKYCFWKLAETIGMSNELARFDPDTLRRYGIKEIQLEDLPLYMNMKSIFPKFERLLQGGRECLQRYMR